MLGVGGTPAFGAGPELTSPEGEGWCVLTANLTQAMQGT